MTSSTTQNLIHDFRQLGLQTGDVVLVHSSLRSIGQVMGGASVVVEALLETVGEQGTVAVPTIIHTSGLPREPFEVVSSLSEVGAITEALRLHLQALRSIHPTHSVAAIGPLAKELVGGHENACGAWTPWGAQAFGTGSPWDLLYSWNARYLFIGVSFQVCTLFHYAQTRYLAKHQCNYAQPIPFPYFSHENMGEMLKEEFQLKPGYIGAAESWLLGARNIVDCTLRVLEHDPASIVPDGPFLDWSKKYHTQQKSLRGAMMSVPLLIDGKSTTGEGTGLRARVLILENEEEQFVLVSLTLLGLTAQVNAFLRNEIARQTGISPQAIMIACTHVHSGPMTLTADESQTTAQLEAISQSLSTALEEAQAKMAPVRLAVAKRPVEGLTRIRRVCMNDGKAYTIRRAVPSSWRSELKAEYVGPDGELDTDLTVARVEDREGNVLGCLFHYSTHPLPDLHGYAADWMEKAWGDGFVSLPLNGAMADVDTIFDQPFNGKFAQAQLPGMGRVLSGAIQELLGRGEAKDDATLKVRACDFSLPVHPFVIEQRRDDPIEWIGEAARKKMFPAQMQAVQLGPLILIGLPGELASSVGLKIKTNSPFQYTCPVSLANDEVGYLITEASRRIGGYEADPAHWALTASGGAEIVYTQAIKLLSDQGRW